MKKLYGLIGAAFVSTALVAPANSQIVIASYTAGPFGSAGSAFNYGQSFTVSVPGSFNYIAINLFRSNAPFANGQLYLFSQAYLGDPADLATTTLNRLGVATADSSAYKFGPSVLLQGGNQYYFYTDNLNFEVNYGTTYAGGSAFQAGTRTDSFYSVNADVDFSVVGTPANTAVPEPATWALMLIGFGSVGFAVRRRQTVSARTRFA